MEKVLTNEQKESEKMQEPKHFMTEKMKYYKEQTKETQIQRGAQVSKDKREKKQNKEI